MTRRLLRVLYPLVVIAGIMFVTAQPAGAVLGSDCHDKPPVAQGPSTGTAAFFGSPPKHIPKDPKGGAFANGAPIFANYNVAGLSFNTYDYGCTGAVKDPFGPIGTGIANWIMEMPKVGVVAVVALMRVGYHPDFLQVFNPLLIHATDALRAAIFTKWAPVTLTIVGVLLIYTSRKARLSDATTVVGWALLVLIVSAAVFRWPVAAGSFADETIGSILGGVNGSINGQGNTADPVDSAASTLSNATLYQQWKRGTFGDPNSETAKKYAQIIYMDKALTWQEDALVHSDPKGAGKALLDAKAKSYADTADKIKAEDPDAYTYLTGHGDASGTRMGAAVIAVVAACCSLLFLVVSCLLMIASFLIVRMGVIFTPLIATIALAHKFRSSATEVVGAIVAALANNIIFGTAAAVNILIGMILLDPASGIPVWLGLALMLLVAVIMGFALWPIAKSLTKLSTPSGVFKGAAGAIGDAGGNMASAAGSVAKAGLVAATAGGAAVAAANWDEDDDEDTRSRSEEAVEVEDPYDPPQVPLVPETPALEAAPADRVNDFDVPVGALPAPGDQSATPREGVNATDAAWPMPTGAHPYDETDVYMPEVTVADPADAPHLDAPIDPINTPEGDVYDLYVPDVDTGEPGWTTQDVAADIGPGE